MKKTAALISLFLFAVLMFNGCSKDDSPSAPNTPQEPAYDQKAIPLITFKAPSTSSTNQVVEEIRNLVSGINYTVQLPPWFEYRTPVQNGNVYTRTYVEGGFSANLIATLSQTDTNNVWKLVLNGTRYFGTSSVTYYNFAEQILVVSKQNRYGNAKIYEPEHNSVVLEASWSKSSDNTLTGEFRPYQESAAFRAVIVNRANNSGEVKTYDGSTLQMEASWGSNGAGQYKTYQNGTQTTGSWN